MDQMKGLGEHRKYLLCRLLASEAFSTCHLDILQLVLIIFVMIIIIIFVTVIIIIITIIIVLMLIIILIVR